MARPQIIKIRYALKAKVGPPTSKDETLTIIENLQLP